MKRCLVSIGLCLALCAGSVQLAASAAASDGPVASASKKKKCKKGKGKASAAKKGKCKKKKGGDDAIGQATSLFAGSSFGAQGCTSTTNCNRSYNYALSFCKNGTYSGRYELNDSITTSTFVDIFSGTWRFTSADSKQGIANLSYCVDTWQSGAGTPQPQGQQNSQVLAQSSTSFLIDDVAFTRAPGGAGC